MRFDKKRVYRILLLSITFLLFMLLFHWYYEKNIAIKTLENILFEIKDVNDVKITKQNGKTIIHLVLKDVDNLMETYNNICSVIKHRLKDKPFELEIINEPINPAIKELFEDKIQFIMYEALRTGKYTEMKLELDKIRYITTEKNRPQNIKIEVFVDLDTLYLQIKTSKSDFYKVIK